MDYILFIKADVDFVPNPNEVQDARYISQGALKHMFQDTAVQFTPWFRLICDSMLFEWWDAIDNGLDGFMNERNIRRM